MLTLLTNSKCLTQWWILLWRPCLKIQVVVMMVNHSMISSKIYATIILVKCLQILISRMLEDKLKKLEDQVAWNMLINQLRVLTFLWMYSYSKKHKEWMVLLEKSGQLSKIVWWLLKVTLLWHLKSWMLLIASLMQEFHISGNTIQLVVKNHGCINN